MSGLCALQKINVKQIEVTDKRKDAFGLKVKICVIS